jgi:hypothetical protein
MRLTKTLGANGLPRVIVADVAHDVTPRGNACGVILVDDSDRITYLELLGQEGFGRMRLH